MGLCFRHLLLYRLMLAIFSVIYYLLYMVITKNGSARDHFFMKSVQILGLGVTAVMISAFMIIPVYQSLSYGKFEFSVPDYSIRENFPLIELLDKILPNSYDTVRMRRYNGTAAPRLFLLQTDTQERKNRLRSGIDAACFLYVYPSVRYDVARRTASQLAPLPLFLYTVFPDGGLRGKRF